ncbi:hypothetical protein CRM22_010477 [Opisthorchis felineus]|uniref:Bestrophin homolog n=2 Tax=Opisthorchis felineus TaxID=147828 RepID=A0A4S2KY96_OPIFE|nr:hypothetical protein CRM22_010477 [Opisthorchis felineus]
MTVQYSQLVLTGGPGVFLRLLLKWRGCVFKLIYVDILVFLGLYFSISLIYRFALTEPLQRNFESLILFINRFQAMIPVAFILGFYVALIFARFWHQFMVIPWVLKIAVGLTAHLPGSDERPRLLRRTCMRYLMGSLILTCTRVNLVAKRRFPNLDAFVTAGVFTEEETKLLDGMELHFQPFAPIIWTTSLITLAEKEKIITNEHALVFLIAEVNNLRQGLLNVFFMDYVCVPLVYTQVVTLSVYSYFIASLIGRQYIMSSSTMRDQNNHDFYFPFFTTLELIIYVGWLKVAETLVNPMGEDDEDIDINEVIDFNWKAAWCIVDGVKPSPPAVVRDAHWNQTVVELPHTEESRQLPCRPCRGSVFDLNLQSSTDFIGSLISMTGVRSAQDTSTRFPSAKRSSVLSILRRPTLLHVREPYVMDSPASDEPDLQISLTVPERLSPSKQSVELHDEDHKSSIVPSKGFAETIKEESEEEYESYTHLDNGPNAKPSQSSQEPATPTSSFVSPGDGQSGIQ